MSTPNGNGGTNTGGTNNGGHSYVGAPGSISAADVPALHAWRLTVTPSTIRAARTVFVVVVGEDKHAALRRVLGDEAYARVIARASGPG